MVLYHFYDQNAWNIFFLLLAFFGLLWEYTCFKNYILKYKTANHIGTCRSFIYYWCTGHYYDIKTLVGKKAEFDLCNYVPTTTPSLAEKQFKRVRCTFRHINFSGLWKMRILQIYMSIIPMRSKTSFQIVTMS